MRHGSEHPFAFPMTVKIEWIMAGDPEPRQALVECIQLFVLEPHELAVFLRQHKAQGRGKLERRTASEVHLARIVGVVDAGRIAVRLLESRDGPVE